MNKDNYHEQGNIIITILLLHLGHISNTCEPARDSRGPNSRQPLVHGDCHQLPKPNMGALLEICPRGNNK